MIGTSCTTEPGQGWCRTGVHEMTNVSAEGGLRPGAPAFGAMHTPLRGDRITDFVHQHTRSQNGDPDWPCRP